MDQKVWHRRSVQPFAVWLKGFTPEELDAITAYGEKLTPQKATVEYRGQRGVADDRIRRLHAPAGLDIGASTPAQAAKVSQKLVKYQDTPKGEQSCENCVQFETPSSCKTVDGTVAAQGWCIVYAKKQA